MQPILDDHFGETFSIEPRAPAADPNARKVADASRPPQTFVGIWSDPHAIVRPTNRTGHPANESDRFSDDRPTVDFTTAALPYRAKIGDLVTRLSNGARYAVSDSGSDGFTRSSIALTASRGSS